MQLLADLSADLAYRLLGVTMDSMGLISPASDML